MYKLFLLTVTIWGFVFAGSWDNVSKSIEKFDLVNNKYCMTNDNGSDDSIVEAGRRRGKGNKGRRRGGGGLR